MTKPRRTQQENRLRRATIEEACEYARIGKTKLYELMNDGSVRAYKQGGLTLVDLNSIDDYQRGLPSFKPRRRT